MHARYSRQVVAYIRNNVHSSFIYKAIHMFIYMLSIVIYSVIIMPMCPVLYTRKVSRLFNTVFFNCNPANTRLPPNVEPMLG